MTHPLPARCPSRRPAPLRLPTAQGLAAALAGAALLTAGAAHAQSPRDLPPIDRAACTLLDERGRTRDLEAFAASPWTVVALVGTECPLARLYAPRLAKLERRYAPRGVAFLGVCPNRQDSFTELKAFAREHGILFPIWKDPEWATTDALAATRTPEVLVLDQAGQIRYRGRIDDQYAIGARRAAPARHDLREALDELLAGREVSLPVTQPPGCLIERGPRAESSPESSQPTWSRDVAPILQAHCQDCHRPGQIGPFPLLTYADTLGWSRMIGEVVAQGRMPPWHANPEFGDFVNDARLSPRERALLLAWVEAGAPEGDPAEAPPPREFVEGWQIPEPDQVVYMSDEPFVVPAEGVVPYQWFEVDPGFKEDKWISAVECRPGNPAVVHHVTVYFRPPWVDWELKLGERINMLGGYSPGKRSINSPRWERMATLVPAGSTLYFEMHYTANGRVETDRSAVAIKFADPSQVEKQMSVVTAAETGLAIPPGDPDYVVRAAYVFDEDSLLYSMSPHMHLRGKAFRFEALYPDGRRETLLDVPRFDFEWQTDYMLRAAKPMPAGTTILCTAHFDNSPHNPANPDPTRTVTWGEQIWDEMMLGGMAIVPADQDLSRGQGKPAVVQGSYRRLRNRLLGGAVLLVALAVGATGWAWRRRRG